MTSSERLMLEECLERLVGLIEAFSVQNDALSKYFEYHGAEHSDENCPQDDTCSCPEHVPLSEAWERLGREIELAYRMVDKIKKALKEGTL